MHGLKAQEADPVGLARSDGQHGIGVLGRRDGRLDLLVDVRLNVSGGDPRRMGELPNQARSPGEAKIPQLGPRTMVSYPYSRAPRARDVIPELDLPLIWPSKPIRASCQAFGELLGLLDLLLWRPQAYREAQMSRPGAR